MATTNKGWSESFFAYTVKLANPENNYRDRLHDIISITSRIISNFVFKFITFRDCINKGWSSKRLNDNVQLANTEILCKNVGPYESNYGKLCAKSSTLLMP